MKRRSGNTDAKTCQDVSADGVSRMAAVEHSKQGLDSKKMFKYMEHKDTPRGGQ